MDVKEFFERYASGERDFSKIVLKKAQLGGIELIGINLSGANMYQANLYRARIERSNLEGINLSNGNLKFSYLKKVNLSRAKLYNADLSEATLEEILLVNANLRLADCTGAKISDSDFNKAELTGAKGLIIEPIKDETKEIDEKDFRCGYCSLIVPAVTLGSAHRNHCPSCGYSKHVDERKGFRNSDCRSLMEPIGLTWKSGGEISLVHLCLGCNSIDYNRIAGDDNVTMLLVIYEKSKNLEPKTTRILVSKEIELIKPNEEYLVKVQLFGKY